MKTKILSNPLRIAFAIILAFGITSILTLYYFTNTSLLKSLLITVLIFILSLLAVFILLASYLLISFLLLKAFLAYKHFQKIIEIQKNRKK